MFLTARMLTNVAGVNSFAPATEVRMSKGDVQDVYFRLIDVDQLPQSLSYNPGGLRYIPAAGATMAVEFQNLDDGKVFSRVASNPFADDRSIWRVSLLATDIVDGTVNLKITLTEGVTTRTIYAAAAIIVMSGFGEVC